MIMDTGLAVDAGHAHVPQHAVMNTLWYSPKAVDILRSILKEVETTAKSWCTSVETIMYWIELMLSSVDYTMNDSTLLRAGDLEHDPELVQGHRDQRGPAHETGGPEEPMVVDSEIPG